MTTVLAIAWGVLGVAQDFVTFKDQPSQDLFVASRAAVARGEGIGEGPCRSDPEGPCPTGAGRWIAGESTVVIKILLPDSYLRTDTIGSAVKATGFQGSHLLTAMTENGQSRRRHRR